LETTVSGFASNLAPQEVGAELAEARAANLAHNELDFAAENVDHLLDARKAAGNGDVEGRRPKKT
jgi:hypothetical protein